MYFHQTLLYIHLRTPREISEQLRKATVLCEPHTFSGLFILHLTSLLLLLFSCWKRRLAKRFKGFLLSEYCLCVNGPSKSLPWARIRRKDWHVKHCVWKGLKRKKTPRFIAALKFRQSKTAVEYLKSYSYNTVPTTTYGCKKPHFSWGKDFRGFLTSSDLSDYRPVMQCHDRMQTAVGRCHPQSRLPSCYFITQRLLGRN